MVCLPAWVPTYMYVFVSTLIWTRIKELFLDRRYTSWKSEKKGGGRVVVSNIYDSEGFDFLLDSLLGV